MYKAKVIEKMKQVFQDVPYGIDHTLKVLDNAEEIMAGEDISADQREFVSIITILHDIGAMDALRKYGSMDAHYQELEGPPIARKILEELEYEPNKIDRVCYIVGNHHTPSRIDGIDFQIQWEADLLENLTAMAITKDAIKLEKFIEKNFKTRTGKAIAYERFMQ
ncbi:phosphohydrolase [Desulfuribacillus stibiiarsenatis]|uniref:Phosphohydrolase n=1 Tax=Desulfuribacillus stibiiarsenatis TaxID=1390249 RepID=A0A1E5L2X5_9FIRM|nr:HD domain-containing protein [Desulfuribacillus stibiiarsenatis]OEH84289.1 phosphohydrolase [Desulfuribacillus stibiiarsenatis]